MDLPRGWQRLGFLSLLVAFAGCDKPVKVSPQIPQTSCEAAGPGGAEPSRIQRSVWASGLQNPWDVVFLPGDEGALVSERPGRVSLRRGDGQRVPVEGPQDVLARGEGGLLGMTLAPDFAGNRMIFLCFSHQGAPNDNRVVRFRLSEDGVRLEQRKDLVTGMPYSSGRHSGCRLLFGSDGFLYVGTGDAAQGEHPQKLTSLGGKVLRITLEGEPAPGNPQIDGKDPRIFTYGHRNVQGLAEQPSTGRIYSGEHGSSIDDEINLLLPGSNFGWSPGLPYQENVPMTDLTRFPEAKTAVWSSGSPTTALSGITFLKGAQWNSWGGYLIGAELKNRRLRLWKLDDAGLKAEVQRELCGEQKVRLRTPVLGPDGALYVTTDARDGGDEIWRLTP